MAMQRNGKTLRTLPDGAPRRLSDGRNAWRKMSPEQRREFLGFLGFDVQHGGPYSDVLDVVATPALVTAVQS